MTEKDYQELSALEEKYWWHIGRRFFLNKLIKKYFSVSSKDSTILDFGCGMGGNYDFLSKYGKVVGIDNSKTSIDYCKKMNQQVELFNGTRIPFWEKSINMITAFDVLEHIYDDDAIIKEYGRILNSGGKAIITVPAYKFLWSDHDEALGHYRRYTASNLRNKFESNGFKTLKISYVISFLFPSIMIYRFYRIIFSRYLTKKTSYVALPKALNSFFAMTIKLESFLLDKFNLPFGCSVVGVFEKK